MLQLSVGTWCVGQVRGNCMRRDPRGLREPLGCRAGRVDTCDSPQATCPHKRTHKNYCHQPDYVTKTQLTQGPALHGAQQLHGRIWCFLSFFMWFVFFFLHFLFFTTVLHYSSFLVLQKLYQVDLFLTMRLISPQRPLLLSVIIVGGQKKREERRKKMQREEEYCAVFLEEKSPGCFTQHLEASAVMVKEGFAIKGVRNQKDILVDTLFKRPNFHILSGNMFHNVFSTCKYHKLGGENKNIFMFYICLEEKIKFVKYNASSHKNYFNF